MYLILCRKYLLLFNKFHAGKNVCCRGGSLKWCWQMFAGWAGTRSTATRRCRYWQFGSTLRSRVSTRCTQTPTADAWALRRVH